MDALGRFYTDTIFSSLLVNNLITKFPKKVIDLGVGDASLSIAAFKKWEGAKFFATEIEKDKIRQIGQHQHLSFLKVFNYDTLDPKASARLKIKFGAIDIAICNPPYLKVQRKERYAKLFKEVGCPEFNNLKLITSEIVFFAHNLKLLKRDGELGIIVSDSLITGKEFKIFRQTIVEKFDLRRIIQLPDKIFKKTEARTHIIFISKRRSNRNSCELLLSDINGRLSKRLKIQKVELRERMDYKFHAPQFKLPKSATRLKDIKVLIKRGKYTYKQLREKNLTFFHSTHFRDFNNTIIFDGEAVGCDKSALACPGDILMCRVGKRVVGKVIFVSKGSALISDCIYKITVPQKYRRELFNKMISSEGQEWLKTYAHGVCSQVISKSDLYEFPLKFQLITPF